MAAKDETMKKVVSQMTSRRSGERGQALLLLLLALGIFLMGAVALTVDISNAWLHRQAAQNAADAACTAGSMDMLVDAQGGATGHQGFTIGTQFNCSSGSGLPPAITLHLTVMTVREAQPLATW